MSDIGEQVRADMVEAVRIAKAVFNIELGLPFEGVRMDLLPFFMRCVDEEMATRWSYGFPQDALRRVRP